MESIKLQDRLQRLSREWQIKIELIPILHNSLLCDRLTLLHFRFLLPFLFVLKRSIWILFPQQFRFPRGDRFSNTAFNFSSKTL